MPLKTVIYMDSSNGWSRLGPKMYDLRVERIVVACLINVYNFICWLYLMQLK